MKKLLTLAIIMLFSITLSSCSIQEEIWDSTDELVMLEEAAVINDIDTEHEEGILEMFVLSSTMCLDYYEEFMCLIPNKDQTELILLEISYEETNDGYEYWIEGIGHIQKNSSIAIIYSGWNSGIGGIEFDLEPLDFMRQIQEYSFDEMYEFLEIINLFEED